MLEVYIFYEFRMADILLHLQTLPERKISREARRRLIKQLQGELTFLERIAATSETTSSSSNLNHLRAVASLLDHPDISDVVSIFHRVNFPMSTVSKLTPQTKRQSGRPTTAVDLVCLWKGEPTWVVAPARNPSFLRWESPKDEANSSVSTTVPPEDSALVSAAPLGNNAGPERNPTHDTGLKNRVATLLEAANSVNAALKPNKVLLYFARGLAPCLQKRLETSFGATRCSDFAPLAFEIRTAPKPGAVKESLGPLDGPESETGVRGRPRGMAPEAEALAWSVVEPLPNSAEGAGYDILPAEENGLTKGWIVVKGTPVCPSFPKRLDDVAHMAKTAHVAETAHVAKHDHVAKTGELCPTGIGGLVGSSVGGPGNPGFPSPVNDAVCESDNLDGGRSAGDTRADLRAAGALDGAQRLRLDGSFVAVDEGDCRTAAEYKSAQLSVQSSSASVGERSSVAVLECTENGALKIHGRGKLGVGDLEGGKGAQLGSEWVAVGPVTRAPVTASDGQFSATSEARGEDKEWVAVPSVVLPQNEQQPTKKSPGSSNLGGNVAPRVGLSCPGETTEASPATIGEWIGIGRPVTGSETYKGQGENGAGADQNGSGRNGTDWNGTEDSGASGPKGVSSDMKAEGDLKAGWLRVNRVQTGGTEQSGMARVAAERSGTERNGTERNPSGLNGTERKATEGNATEWNGTERNVTQPNGTERNASEQNGAEREALWRNGAESIGTETNRTESDGTGHRADESPATGTCKTGADDTRGFVEVSYMTPGRADPFSQDSRFRPVNPAPLTTRPGSWPAGLELINLDTTALVAFVSGMTNGDAEGLRSMSESEFWERWKGNAGFMRDQIEAEVQYPQLPYLESVTSGKGVLVTEYVLQEFVSIVSVVGGPRERARAELLLRGCWLVADGPSDRLRSLPASRTIRTRHVTIFGTADTWGCPTLTSNAAFARAVRKLGVPLWVLEHRPSALVGT